MVDPLAEVVTLLQPQARYSKIVDGAGSWRIRRAESGQPFYCVILDGGCRLTLDGHMPLELRQGDFVLIPAAHGFTMSSLAPAVPQDADSVPLELPQGQFRLGDPDGPPDTQLLVGHCAFGSPDAALLVSLLPQLVHVHGEHRLATLVQLVTEESRARLPGREVILAHLLEVLLIEALRSTAGRDASNGPENVAAPGLLRGLADDRLAAALRCMHDDMARAWTVAELAQQAALSRSAFFERFSRAVGVAPMEYLLAWRMACARNLLRRKEGVATVATLVGYGSASAFSVAFARHVGMPPARYAREQMVASN